MIHTREFYFVLFFYFLFYFTIYFFDKYPRWCNYSSLGHWQDNHNSHIFLPPPPLPRQTGKQSMLAIQATKSSPPKDQCTPNLLPCRIHHNGPANASRRYWNPTVGAGTRPYFYIYVQYIHTREMIRKESSFCAIIGDFFLFFSCPLPLAPKKKKKKKRKKGKKGNVN